MAKELEQHGTVIIGAGPGGYVAAIRAAELGQQVTVIEESDTLGGICLNVGCVPSKALISAGKRLSQAQDSTMYGITTGEVSFDFTALQDWKQHKVVDRMTKGIEGLFAKHGIEVVRGSAMLVSDTEIQIMPAGPQQFMDDPLLHRAARLHQQPIAQRQLAGEAIDAEIRRPRHQASRQAFEAAGSGSPSAV